jgi:hypothetical protein
MVQSAAKSVPQYLDELPPERRAVVERVRDLVNENLPPGYVESMASGMICWSIPLARYPNTYNGQPLGYVALAAQKHKYSLYLCEPYMFGEERAQRFRARFVAAGKKLDMGMCCVRFKRVEDLALEVVAESIAAVPVDEFIRQYEKVRASTASGTRPVKKKAASNATKKAAGTKKGARQSPKR